MRHIRTELNFDAATEEYKQFIAGQGFSTDILWVFREDVTVNKGRTYVRWPLPADNRRLAQELYEQGRDKGLGISLSAFCLVNHRPCCYVWVPEDEIDADHAMLSDLKLRVPTKPIHARRVHGKLLWKVITWLSSRSKVWGFEQEIPRRN